MTKYVLENSILYPGEIFKPITSDVVYAVRNHYQVSNYGRIYSSYSKKFLKPDITNCGYYRVSLTTLYGYKHESIHRLVLMTFNPVPNMHDLEVNHINGDKSCNILLNLEWSTSSYNKIHGINTNLYNTTVSKEKVVQICELLQMDKFTNVEIANMLNVKVHIVNQVKNGDSWTHISCNYNITPHRVSNTFVDDQIHNLCKYFEMYPRNNLTITAHCINALNYCGYEPNTKYINSTKDLYMHRTYLKISSQYNF